jgi:acyl-CoA synthetase (AMP-forming)/AMP-acid ligase II
VELKVVDGDGVEIAPGEVGNLVARGDNVTLGYLDEPEETAVMELRRFCRQLLPAFKVPGTITFVKALPRNQAGKLLRAEVAACGVPAPREGP